MTITRYKDAPILPPPAHPVTAELGAMSDLWYRYLREVTRRLDAVRVIATTEDFTAGGERLILVDATAGAVTVSLPKAAKHHGRVYTVKKIDASANAVTVDGNGSETIDGAATQSLASQWDSITVVNNGTGWFKT